MKVSVVIVSYNTKDLLRRCIESVEGAHEIIVVDNASTDGSIEMLRGTPGIELIANPFNRGFGAANNQGIQVATGDLVLLLNSDARAHPGSVDTLSAVFDDPHVVAAGGKLLNPDRSLQESCSNELTLWAVFCEQLYLEKLFPRSRFFSPYWMSRRLGSDRPSKVYQVMGACLMMRPVEAFDERFFLYCEDTELCKRLRDHGDILYVPGAPFTHDLGSSGRAARWKSIALYNRGKELYFKIHSGWLASYVCFKTNRFGALLRFLAWGIPTILSLGVVPRFRKQAWAFLRVLFAPIRAEKLFR